MESIDQLLIPPTLYRYIPMMVRSELAKMSAQKQSAFLFEYERTAKTTGIAYLFWVLFGAHYAYVGKWGLQATFWITCGGAGVWMLVDLFRIPGIITEYNQEVSTTIMRNMKAFA